MALSNMGHKISAYNLDFRELWKIGILLIFHLF